MTNYTIIYQVGNRVKRITIPAHSPMEAFKKFKEMMPQIVYNNLSVKNVEVNIPIKDCVNKSEPKKCLPYAPDFDKLFKMGVDKPIEKIIKVKPFDDCL